MIIDKKSFFNVNVKDVNANEIVQTSTYIRALENDLATILAQVPADDKMELLLKFHNKTSDNGAAVNKAIDGVRAAEAKAKGTDDVNLADALGAIVDGINSLGDKLDSMGKKGPKKK